MLRTRDYGPVRYFSVGRSWAGRTIMTSGVYFVDGTLIDTGPANAQVDFATALSSVDAEQLVLTHHHEDHVGNAAFAASHFERPPLMHRLGLPLVRHPARLPAYRRVTWGAAAAFDAEPLGDVLATRNHAFEVIHTPGHALDHIALYEPTQRWLFAGDLYISSKLAVMIASEDATSLIASLRRLLKLPDCTLFCQHSGAHQSHQRALGARLDFLLCVQQQAVALHEQGRSAAEIARHLGIEQPAVKLLSGGEMSARNLVCRLLRDAGIDAADG